MSQEENKNEKRLEKLFKPIDENLEFYRNSLKRLEKELEKEEADFENIQRYSSEAAFYSHLLGNHFYLDEPFFWRVFVSQDNRKDFLKKISERSEEFEDLYEEMERVDDKMGDYIEEREEEEGEEGVRKLLDKGYKPPFLFLATWKQEQQLGTTPEEDLEINRAYWWS